MLAELVAALAIAVPVQTPTKPVTVIDQDCPTYGAGSRISCVYMDRPYTMYLTRDTVDRHVLYYHELAHVLVFSGELRPWQRRAFRKVMGYGIGERFADAYMWCAVGGPNRSGYGYNPTPAQHRNVCRIVAKR